MKRIFSVAVVVLLAIATGRANAIPAFARAFDAKCSMCHWPVPPRLNNVGLAFRRMGFRLPDTQDDKLIFKNLPGKTPFDTTSLIGIVSTHDTSSNASTTTLNVDEADLLSAGNFGQKGSYFLQFATDGTENFHLEKVEGEYVSGKPESSFILRAGRMEPIFWEKGNESSITISTPLIYGLPLPAGGGSASAFGGFSLGEPANGFEVGGAINHLSETGGLSSTFASAAVFNSNNSGDATSASRARDVMLQIMHTWSETNTVNASWYHGTGTGLTSGDNPTFFRDRFDRVILSGSERLYKGLDLVGAYMFGHDDTTDAGKFDSHGYFVELSHALGEKAAVIARWDDVHAGGVTRGYTLGFDYRPSNNLIFRLEYHNYAPVEPATGLDSRDLGLQAIFAY